MGFLFYLHLRIYIKNPFWQKKSKRNMKQTNVNPKVKCRKTKYQAICYHGFRPFYTKKTHFGTKVASFFKNVLSTRTKFAQVDHESSKKKADSRNLFELTFEVGCPLPPKKN